jgi:hypothetical protein
MGVCKQCAKIGFRSSETGAQDGAEPDAQAGMSGRGKLVIGLIAFGIIIVALTSGGNDAKSSRREPLPQVQGPPGPSAEELRVRRERPRADSILRALTVAKVLALPDSTLTFITQTADSSANLPVFLKAASVLAKRKMDRAENAARVAEETARHARVASVIDLASSASTVDGKQCRRASEATASRLIAKYPGWPDGILAVVMCGWVQTGMTAQQLRASWGAPEDINRTVGSWGVHEQWVYSGSYVYLEDGVVTSFQN